MSSKKKNNLSALFTQEGMAPFLSNPDIQKKLQLLLPKGVSLEKIIEYIQKALGSPQFQQSMDKMKGAPGQLTSLLAQYGPGSSKGTDQEEVEAMARAMQEEESGGKKLDLSKVLSPDVMAPILANPTVQEKLKPHLPAGMELPKTPEELKKALASPEFQQALTLLSAATASEQLKDLMQQFGLPDTAVKAADNGDLEEFAKSLQLFSDADMKLLRKGI